MNYLSTTPDIASGHLVLKGTRIRIAHVLKLILDRLSPEEIHAEWYPHLSPDVIRGAAEEAIRYLSTQTHA